MTAIFVSIWIKPPVVALFGVVSHHTVVNIRRTADPSRSLLNQLDLLFYFPVLCRLLQCRLTERDVYANIFVSSLNLQYVVTVHISLDTEKMFIESTMLDSGEFWHQPPERSSWAVPENISILRYKVWRIIASRSLSFKVGGGWGEFSKF